MTPDETLDDRGPKWGERIGLTWNELHAFILGTGGVAAGFTLPHHGLASAIIAVLFLAPTILHLRFVPHVVQHEPWYYFGGFWLSFLLGAFVGVVI